MNDLAKNVVLWIVIAVVLATVVSNFSTRTGAVREVPYSTFLEQVKDGSVSFIGLGKRYMRIDVSLKKHMDRLLNALGEIRGGMRSAA